MQRKAVVTEGLDVILGVDDEVPYIYSLCRALVLNLFKFLSVIVIKAAPRRAKVDVIFTRDGN